MQGFPAVAETLHRAGPEVLDQHVGPREQTLEERAIGGQLEIEREALLAAVQRQEIRGAILDEGPDAARVGADLGPLDLHDARAEIGEQHRAVRTREHPRQIDDERACQRSGVVGDVRRHEPLAVDVGRAIP